MNTWKILICYEKWSAVLMTENGLNHAKYQVQSEDGSHLQDT